MIRGRSPVRSRRPGTCIRTTTMRSRRRSSLATRAAMRCRSFLVSRGVTMKRLGTFTAGVGIVVSTIFTSAQTANQLPRTPEGKPDFSGLWQALNTAAWDLQDHSSSVFSGMGVPPGKGVVQGGEIPYKPEALEQKKKNFANRTT